MQLRVAENDDAETVVQIFISSRAAYLPYAKTPHSINEVRQWVRGILIPSGGVIIAQLNGEDVGVLATSVSEAVGWIDQLYLLPGYIGQGIGTHLLKHAFTVLPRPIRLWTFQQNDRAIRFYEYHGFKAIRVTNGENNEESCPYILYEYT